MGLVENAVGLWFVAIACTTAAVLCGWGAMMGIVQHRFPRILVAVSVSMIALSYWWEIVVGDGPGNDLRRGAAWLLWPSLAWTAWSGVKYSRGVVAEIEHARQLLDDD